MVHFTLCSLYSTEQTTRYPMNRRLNELQSRSGRPGENIYCPCQESNSSSSAFQPVLTTLIHFESRETLRFLSIYNVANLCIYQAADKSLARPGRKRVRKHVRDARDFNNIETRAVKFLFFARQGAEGNSRHSDRNIGLFHSWSG